MLNPLISIILPNYNHACYLHDRLDSIFNQTYTHFEVIILDDCSTDGSLELLSVYKNHPKVSHFIINSTNTGSPFKQWHKGLKLAQGEYIWIAESDDSCALNFLDEQLNILENTNAAIAVANTKILYKTELQRRVNHPIFKNADRLIVDLSSFLFCPILNMSTVLFKKELYGPLMTFDTYQIIGDRVFYFEAFQNKNIILNHHTASYFRKEDDSVSTLSSKGILYLKRYYIEHQRFAKSALVARKIDKEQYIAYVKRFFFRVRDRLDKKQKLSFTYAMLYMKFLNDIK